MREGLGVAVAAGLSVGLLVLATVWLRAGGSEVATSRVGAEVARVVCDGGDATVAARVVRAAPAGVRFVVEGRAASLLVDPVAAGPTAEIVLDESSTEATLVVPPGRARLSCTARSGDELGRATDIAIVDVERSWVSPELACDRAQEREFEVRFAAPETGAETLLRTLPDLVRPEEVATPGYGATRWHGDLVVVVRDGRTVGRATRAQNQGVWTVVVTACPASGLIAG